MPRRFTRAVRIAEILGAVAAAVVLAILFVPRLSSGGNAASVCGCRAAHCRVTAQPCTGNASVAPWSRSASWVTPIDSSAWLANGSGSTAAVIFPALSIAAIVGSG